MEVANMDLSTSNSSNIVAIEEETEKEQFDKHGFLRDSSELEAESVCNGLWFVDDNIYHLINFCILVLKLMRLLQM